MYTILPRPRSYKGTIYRSSLECAWAYFFDEINVDAYYESYRLRLPSGDTYLPDYYMPEQKSFFEVKSKFNRKFLKKPIALWEALGRKTGSVVIGNSKGEILVPHVLDTGKLSWIGATFRCVECGNYWFSNPAFHNACRCPKCGDEYGGINDQKVWQTLGTFGVRCCWAGKYDQVGFRDKSKPISKLVHV